MSERTPEYSGNEEFDDIDAELQRLLAAEEAHNLTIENAQVFRDAVTIQAMFDGQIFTDLPSFSKGIEGAVSMLDQAALDAGLIGRPVSLIGPADAILRPHIAQSVLDHSLLLNNTAEEDATLPIAEGLFRGFTIAPVAITDKNTAPQEEDEEDDTPTPVAFRPQLYYQVYTKSLTLPHADAYLFHLGEVKRTTPIFSPEYPEVSLTSDEDDTPEEQLAVEHFNDMIYELSDSPCSNAKELRLAQEHAFYLLNKSVYAHDPSLEDLIVDAVSRYITFDKPFKVTTDFSLKTSNTTGAAMNVEFMRVDSPTYVKGGVVFKKVPIHAVSCLPRAYIQKPSASKDGTLGEVVSKKQRALYLTAMVKDETYHIPFEYIRSIEPLEQ